MIVHNYSSITAVSKVFELDLCSKLCFETTYLSNGYIVYAIFYFLWNSPTEIIETNRYRKKCKQSSLKNKRTEVQSWLLSRVDAFLHVFYWYM